MWSARHSGQWSALYGSQVPLPVVTAHTSQRSTRVVPFAVISTRGDWLAVVGSQWSARSRESSAHSHRLAVVSLQSSARIDGLAVCSGGWLAVVGSHCWPTGVSVLHGRTPDHPPSSEWVSQVHPCAWMCTRDGATHVQSAVDCRLAHRTAPAWRGSPAPPCQA